MFVANPPPTHLLTRSVHTSPSLRWALKESRIVFMDTLPPTHPYSFYPCIPFPQVGPEARLSVRRDPLRGCGEGGSPVPPPGGPQAELSLGHQDDPVGGDGRAHPGPEVGEEERLPVEAEEVLQGRGQAGAGPRHGVDPEAKEVVLLGIFGDARGRGEEEGVAWIDSSVVFVCRFAKAMGVGVEGEARAVVRLGVRLRYSWLRRRNDELATGVREREYPKEWF